MIQAVPARPSYSLPESADDGWPHRGTRAREWFEEHGTLYGEEGFSSLVDYDLTMDEPVVETQDYTRWERKRAWIKATLQTGAFHFRPGLLPRIVGYVTEYRLHGDFWVMLTSRSFWRHLLLGIPGARSVYSVLRVVWRRILGR